MNNRIIENPVLKVFTPFAKFYKIIFTKMAPKLYNETLIYINMEAWILYIELS